MYGERGRWGEMERNRKWNIKCSSLFSFSFGLTHCCSSLDRCPLLFSSLLHSATHYLTPLHTTSLHYTLPHSTTHYLTPLHSSWMSSYVCPFLFLLAPRPFSDPRLHTYQLLVQSLSTYMPFSSATFSVPCKIDFKLMMI